jgi:hypothetical protein
MAALRDGPAAKGRIDEATKASEIAGCVEGLRIEVEKIIEARAAVCGGMTLADMSIDEMVDMKAVRSGGEKNKCKGVVGLRLDDRYATFVCNAIKEEKLAIVLPSDLEAWGRRTFLQILKEISPVF